MKVSAKQYANTLYELTIDKNTSEVDDVVTKFVAYMKKTGDFKKSQDVIKQFHDVYNNENGIVEATVISVRDLTADEQKRVQSFVKKKYNAESVIMNSVINKDIKGGIIIKVDDEILDGSVNGRLTLLKRNLK